MLGVLGAGAPAAPGSSLISAIEIKSEWFGLPNVAERYDVVLRRKGTRFVSADRSVDPEKIRALIAALDQPERPAPINVDFGITNAWLNRNAARAFTVYINNGSGGGEGFYTAAQRSLYLGEFKNSRTVAAALAHYYADNRPIADDAPDVTLSLRMSDRRTITIHSDRTQALMLPWSVIDGPARRNNFNPAISEAIGAFLPRNYVNHERLSLATLLTMLPRLVGTEIETAWNKLPKFDLESLVTGLEQRYHVHVSHGDKVTSDSMLAWNAGLWWDDSLPNTGAVVSLPIVNNKIKNTESIPAARVFLQTTVQIPWVRQVLKNRPEIKLQVLIENDRGTTLSSKDQADLLADMKALGREGVVDESALPTVFKVMFEEPRTFSEWVILPNQDAVLWHFDDASAVPILDLTTDSLEGKQCHSSIFMCSGLLRKPDGTIIR
ncbi:MAG TPA: hypothetical protein VFO29_03705 [Candidatus Rubrimentiphilum sp.]|nr:hypothetical protein [Candidatus Rubrimentiphilum sp.]